MTNLAYQITEPAGVTPALAVRDVARATAFYQRAFAAAVMTRTVGPGGELASCFLSINGAPVVVTEGAVAQGLGLHLQVDDVERWWRRALAAGCEVEMPLGIGIGGHLQGTLRDLFGLAWTIAGARVKRRTSVFANLG